MSELLDPSWSESMSSAEGSPAKTYQSPARGLALLVIEAAFGRSTSESLAKFDPDSQSWRMSSALLPQDSMPSLGTLPRSGWMRSGSLYPRPMWERPTNGLDCFSLPTVTASEWKDRSTPAVLARLYGVTRARGDRTAKCICAMSPTARLEKGPVCLNPSYAEWMHGLPALWTDCGPLGTASCRKSRKSSGG